MAVPAEAIRRFKRLRDRAEYLHSAGSRLWADRAQVEADIGAVQRELVPDTFNRVKEADWQSQGMWADHAGLGHGIGTDYPANSYELTEEGELIEVSFRDGIEEDLGYGASVKRKERVVRPVKSERLLELGRRWHRLRQELAELDQRRAQIDALWTPLKRLVTACEQYLWEKHGWRADGNAAAMAPPGSFAVSRAGAAA